MTNDTFSIGMLSKRAGVKIPTVRYYEQIGLLNEPGRSEGNQRRYHGADLERLLFIRHARELGFPLAAVSDLIALNGHPGQPCTDATRIAQAQLEQVQSRLKQLKKLEKELRRISQSCAVGETPECNVLAALADHSLCFDNHDKDST